MQLHSSAENHTTAPTGTSLFVFLLVGALLAFAFWT